MHVGVFLYTHTSFSVMYGLPHARGGVSLPKDTA